VSRRAARIHDRSDTCLLDFTTAGWDDGLPRVFVLKWIRKGAAMQSEVGDMRNDLQMCTVTNGGGTVGATNIGNVAITCVTPEASRASSRRIWQKAHGTTTVSALSQSSERVMWV
jgi:hypothetical protein